MPQPLKIKYLFKHVSSLVIHKAVRTALLSQSEVVGIYEDPVCEPGWEDDCPWSLVPRCYTLSPARLDLGRNFLNGFCAHSPLYKPSTSLFIAKIISLAVFWSPLCRIYTLYSKSFPHTHTLQNSLKPSLYLNSIHSFISFFTVFLFT